MAETRFTCPHCQQILRSSRPVPAGTDLKCPKCGKSFSVPEEEPVEAAAVAEAAAVKPAPDSSVKTYGFQESPQPPPPSDPPRSRRKKSATETADEDDDLDLDDEEEEELRPRRRLRRAAAKDGDDEADDSEDDDLPLRKPRGAAKEKKSNVLAIVLIAGGALLILLAGGGAGAYWYLNRDRNSRRVDDPLVYLPADSQFIFGFDGGALMNQPGIEAMIEKAASNGVDGNALAQMKKDTGIEFKELFNTVVCGYRPGNVPASGKIMLVAKSRVAFDQHKVRDSCKEAIPVRFEGRTYFRVNGGPNFKFLYMPSKWIIVMTNAPESELQALIASETAPPAAKGAHFDMVRDLQANHFWGVLDLTDTVKGQSSLPQGHELRPFADAVKQARAAALWGTLESNNLSVTLGVKCTDNASAKKLTTAAKGLWDTQMRASGAQALSAALFFPKFRDLQRELNSTVRFSTQEQKSLVSARINMQTLQAVAQDVQTMMSQTGQAAATPGRGPAMQAPQAPGGRGGRGGRGRGGAG